AAILPDRAIPHDILQRTTRKPMNTLVPKPAEQPLDRAIAILTALSEAARPLSITELASACSLPVTTVHRMAAQLEQRHLVKRAIGSTELLVGPGLIRLGAAASEAAMRSDRPHQILVALAQEIGESCQRG